MNSNNIKDMALGFRNAIISLKELPPNFTKSYFGKFPRGCCGVTSELFMYYLLQNNIDSEYWLGDFRFKDFHSRHAWLKIGEYYLDLTADQFNEIGELNFSPIILEKEDEYPLSIYIENPHKGVGIQGSLKGNKQRYDLIVDVIENGYSEERVIKKIFNF